MFASARHIVASLAESGTARCQQAQGGEPLPPLFQSERLCPVPKQVPALRQLAPARAFVASAFPDVSRFRPCFTQRTAAGDKHKLEGHEAGPAGSLRCWKVLGVPTSAEATSHGTRNTNRTATTAEAGSSIACPFGAASGFCRRAWTSGLRRQGRQPAQSQSERVKWAERPSNSS